ncbi:lipid A-modifier LpxR family protein [Pseudodonghicola flavimaris]|uniref:DUF2219 family protein n=1 Tax=Pseudodonghicola flavimaris TaxID=3050036 RepID=A0ABT7EYI8_9RHOB|nr:lipid A-modifier LpxR family protein [Pseudodonghicola flavimaris]MDK3017412.1 DUF2219 family protein [Pseudodonghicola flavimaris]
MFRTLFTLCGASLLIATAAQAGNLETPAAEGTVALEAAQDSATDTAPGPRRHKLGVGAYMTNDFLGDHDDRWRTGAIGASYVRGYDWTGSAPAGFGELIEYRFLSQVIAPADLVSPNPADRPYAGAISLGVHSHMNRDGLELSLGGDLVFIGPQTGIDNLHENLHQLFGSTEPGAGMLANQIGNTVRPTAVAEIGRSFDLGGRARLRPFAEARAGDETLLRVGADLTFGPAGLGELLVRDPVTGQRYRVVTQAVPGFSFTLGGDIAYVADSVYLPSGRGYDLTDHRDRLRAGIHWQGRRTGIFFGMAYLGEEFRAQPESQVVGLLQVKMTF